MEGVRYKYDMTIPVRFPRSSNPNAEDIVWGFRICCLRGKKAVEIGMRMRKRIRIRIEVGDAEDVVKELA